MNVSALKEAFRINEFCQIYPISRAQAYKEIAAGRLKAKKVGSATLIPKDAADEWLRSLPSMKSTAA
jgi:excisionase family DNA binding protein